MTNGSCHSTCESNVHPYRKPRSSASHIRSTTAAAGGSVCSTSPKSICAPPGWLRQVLAGLAAQEAAVARGPAVLAAGDDDPAPGQHGVHPAGDLHALVRRVIHVHVMGGGRQ